MAHVFSKFSGVSKFVFFFIIIIIIMLVNVIYGAIFFSF